MALPRSADPTCSVQLDLRLPRTAGRENALEAPSGTFTSCHWSCRRGCPPISEEYD